jgi:hypothetical protein
MRPANFPNRVRARREKALTQREAQLATWTKGGVHGFDEKQHAEKIERAESDIANLKKKVA